MDNNKKLTDNLKLFRKGKNLTQGDVAEILNKDRSSIAKYESGKAVPPFNVLRLLSKLYDITIDELCGLTPVTTLSVRNEDEETTDPLSKFSKEEQIMIYKFKMMDDEKKKLFMEIFKDFLENE